MADELTNEPDNVTAGLIQPPTTEDTPSAISEFAQNDLAWQERLKRQDEVEEGYNGNDVALDIIKTSLTGTLYNRLTEEDTDGPELTDERFGELFKMAQEKLPPEWLPELYDAENEAEFNQILTRSMDSIAASDRLNNNGWSPWVANMIGQALDPASLAIGFGVMAPAVKASQAYKLGNAARRGVNAAAGAASVGAVVGSMDALGTQPSAQEYGIGMLLGAGLGAAFGPLGKNPNTSAEAKMIQAATSKAAADLEAGKMPELLMLPHPDHFKVQDYVPTGQPFRPTGEAPAAPAPVTHEPYSVNAIVTLRTKGDAALVKQLEGYDLAQLQQVANENSVSGVAAAKTPEEAIAMITKGAWGRHHNRLAAMGGESNPHAHVAKKEMEAARAPDPVVTEEAPRLTAAQARAKNTAVRVADDRVVQAKASIGGTDDVQAIKTAIHQLEQDKAARKGKLPKWYDDTLAELRSRLPSRVEEITVKAKYGEPEAITPTPQMTRNARFVNAFKSGDDEFHVHAQSDDMSGPFKITKMVNGKSAGIVAKDLAREDVLDAIPKTESLVPEELGAPPEVAADLANQPLDHEMAARIAALPDVFRELDPKLADELEQVLEPYQGFALVDDESNPLQDIYQLTRDRQAMIMRLKGARERGEGAEMIEAYEGAIRDFTDLIGDKVETAPTKVGESSAGAAQTPKSEIPADHTFDIDAAVKQLKDSDVGYSAWTKARPDNASFTNGSPNPVTRMGSQGLLNDVVGQADHGVSGVAADLDQRQTFARWTVPYAQARNAQWKVYAKAMKIPFTQRFTRRDEFYRATGQYIKGKPLPDTMPAEAKGAITKFAAEIQRNFQTMAEEAINPGAPFGKTLKAIPGADQKNLIPGQWYLPKSWSHERIRWAEEQGLDRQGFYRLINDAIKKAQPDIPPEYLERLSRGFADQIRNRAWGIADEWTVAFQSRDRGRLANFLRQDAGFNPDEAEEVLRIILDRKPDPGGQFANFKNRVLMDDTHVDPQTKIGIMDLVDTNVDRLVTGYARRLSGRVALARMQIKMPTFQRFKTVTKFERNKDHPDFGKQIGPAEQVPDGFGGGEVLVDGIRLDEDFETLARHMKGWAANSRDDVIVEQTKKDVERLRWAYDRIMGRPDPVHMTTPAKLMRNFRDYNFMRLMWSAPVSMMNEFALPVAALGVKAAFSHVPAFRRVIDAAGRSRYGSVLHDEIEAMGIGADNLHKANLRQLEQFGEGDAGTTLNPKRWDRITEFLQFGTRFTAQYSGMSSMQALSERYAAAAVLQRLANMSKTAGKFAGDDLKRWRQLGLSDEMTKRVFDNFKHVSEVDGVLFKGKLKSLNLDKWEPEVSMALQQTVFRLTRKLIQQQDIGNTAIWMSKPLAQTFFQFRNFSFSAHSNHMLYNLHMRDAAAVKTIMWSTGWAAMVRGLQVKALAQLRPDKESYEERYLDPWELAKAGFSRSGYAAVSPMFIDTLLYLMDRPMAFDGARGTGQATDIIGGSPTGSLIDGLGEGVSGLAGSWIDGRRMSQAELKGLGNSLPGATIPITGALGHLISDRAKRAPNAKRKRGT